MVKNKKKRTLIGVLIVVVLIAAFIGGTLIAQKIAGSVSRELSAEEGAADCGYHACVAAEIGVNGCCVRS